MRWRSLHDAFRLYPERDGFEGTWRQGSRHFAFWVVASALFHACMFFSSYESRPWDSFKWSAAKTVFAIFCGFLAAPVSVLCGGPRLVRDGTAWVDPRSEGFRDSGFFRPAARSAVGVTKENKLLLVTVNKPIYLSHMGRIMRDLGAVDAMNLDGGSSTALYCGGVVPSHPGRRLTNLLVIYDSLEKYARVKPILCPSPMIAGSPSNS